MRSGCWDGGGLMCWLFGMGVTREGRDGETVFKMLVVVGLDRPVDNRPLGGLDKLIVRTDHCD